MTGATFTHIEDNFAFPLPSSAALDNYIVYIGFDPIGAEASGQGETAARAQGQAEAEAEAQPQCADGVTELPSAQIGDSAL